MIFLLSCFLFMITLLVLSFQKIYEMIIYSIFLASFLLLIFENELSTISDFNSIRSITIFNGGWIFFCARKLNELNNFWHIVLHLLKALSIFSWKKCVLFLKWLSSVGNSLRESWLKIQSHEKLKKIAWKMIFLIIVIRSYFFRHEKN